MDSLDSCDLVKKNVSFSLLKLHTYLHNTYVTLTVGQFEKKNVLFALDFVLQMFNNHKE